MFFSVSPVWQQVDIKQELWHYFVLFFILVCILTDRSDENIPGESWLFLCHFLLLTDSLIKLSVTINNPSLWVCEFSPQVWCQSEKLKLQLKTIKSVWITGLNWSFFCVLDWLHITYKPETFKIQEHVLVSVNSNDLGF